MKKIKRLLIIILLLFSITPVYATTTTRERTEQNYQVPSGITVTENNKNNVLTTPAVDEQEKVYDFADLFSDEEEIKLLEKINLYINEYNLDLAVVTINQNNKRTPQEYADDFYDYNNFGKNNTKDGLLFLIDMENREIYMTTTGYAITMYNDYRINTSLDKVYKKMTNKEYYEGVSNYIDIISKYASLGPPSSKDKRVEQSLVKTLLYSSGISLVITIIIMIVLINKNKLVSKKTTAEQYLKKESVKIEKLGNVLINSHTTRSAINHDSGGGSSTHSGSSGVSHGGGGHGF